MKEKFLPLGTVVLLNGATKRIMITGYCSAVPENPEKTYDYVGCLFPEGNLAGEEVALFDHNQIGTIAHMGLVDDEFNNFDKEMKQLLKENATDIATAENSSQVANQVNQTPVPIASQGTVGSTQQTVPNQMGSNLQQANIFSGRLEDWPPMTPDNIQKILAMVKQKGMADIVKEPTAFSEEVFKKPNFSKTSLTKDKKEEGKISNEFSAKEDIEKKESVSDGTPVLQLQLIDGNGQPTTSENVIKESVPSEAPVILSTTTTSDNNDSGTNSSSTIPTLERL